MLIRLTNHERIFFKHIIIFFVGIILRYKSYRVSQKKGGLVFRACFEVFRGFKSKKFRRLTPIKILFYIPEYVFSLI